MITNAAARKRYRMVNILSRKELVVTPSNPETIIVENLLLCEVFIFFKNKKIYPATKWFANRNSLYLGMPF
jgi:hypothetical protein